MFKKLFINLNKKGGYRMESLMWKVMKKLNTFLRLSAQTMDENGNSKSLDKEEIIGTIDVLKEAIQIQMSYNANVNIKM